VSRRHLSQIRILALLWGLAGVFLMSTGTHADHGSHNDHDAAHLPITRLLDIYECTRCHRLHSPHRMIGPSLWQLGERADAAAIRASIVTPDAVVTPGYPAGLMQQRLQDIGFYDDIARQPAILDRLVAYLAGSANVSSAPDRTVLSQQGMIHIAAGAVFQPDGQRVETSAFAIDTTPVSKAQFAAFMADGGYSTKRYWDRGGWAIVVRRRNRHQPLGWDGDRDASSLQPVVGVSWYEADAYCRWAGKTLPSAAQWQRACRAIPTWFDTASQATAQWEWTAEALWHGSQGVGQADPDRCAAQVESHPALDGRQTGFRCSAAAGAASSVAAPSEPQEK
jgi:hypothetical protein